jgi:Ca2+-binding RTX toxin-like protein
MKSRLQVNCLETKVVPSGNPIPEGITLNAYGTLYVNGDAQDQKVTTFIGEDGLVHAQMGHFTYVPDGQGGMMKVLFQDVEKTFDPAKVKRIYFIGDEGNDQFTNDTAIPCTALGGEGHDDLIGGSAADYLVGGNGDDSMEGRQGNDTTKGGAGGDVYGYNPAAAGNGGLGSDSVIEAASVDSDRLDFSGLTGGITININSINSQVVKSGALSLTLSSSLGIEEVWGTNSADKILGNNRANTLLGFNGNDTITGAAGNDSITSGSGSDSVDGGSGNDTINTDSGNDTVNGSTGNDTITAGTGHDSLNGSAGNDVIYGQGGNDTVNAGSGNDQVYGYEGDDVLKGDAGHDQIYGGSEDDQLVGGTGNDQLYGEAGDDELLGEAGNDILEGEAGNDWLDGGTGRDTMNGGVRDYDSLFADQGNETLSEGEHVEITVPGGNKQKNNWSCGPNSAWRLLSSYGISVSYEQLQLDAKKQNIITTYGLGTPGPSLLAVLKKYRASSQLKMDANFQDILDRLGEGRPVIALIGWGVVPVPSPNIFKPIDFVPEKLHYICLTGFDMAENELYYTDTNGEAKTMSFEEFQNKWDWTADGFAYEGLKALGVNKQTMLW